MTANGPANVQGRASGEVTADAMKIAQKIDFPEGYGITLGGASRERVKVYANGWSSGTDSIRGSSTFQRCLLTITA